MSSLERERRGAGIEILRLDRPDVRNALDRARLRQANRLFESAAGPLDAEALSTITAADIRASRVFSGGLDVDRTRSAAAD